MIKFRFNAEKAIAYVAERVRLEGRVDSQALFGTLYLADKEHLLDWGRTVFGGDYEAEAIGPVHVQVRQMLNGDPVHLCAAGLDAYPWRTEGRWILSQLDAVAPDVLMLLSHSDVRALRVARHGAYESLQKNPLRDRALHDAAWSKARGGRILFEDIALEAGIELDVADMDAWHVLI